MHVHTYTHRVDTAMQNLEAPGQDDMAALYAQIKAIKETADPLRTQLSVFYHPMQQSHLVDVLGHPRCADTYHGGKQPHAHTG